MGQFLTQPLSLLAGFLQGAFLLLIQPGIGNRESDLHRDRLQELLLLGRNAIPFLPHDFEAPDDLPLDPQGGEQVREGRRRRFELFRQLPHQGPLFRREARDAERALVLRYPAGEGPPPGDTAECEKLGGGRRS